MPHPRTRDKSQLLQIASSTLAGNYVTTRVLESSYRDEVVQVKIPNQIHGGDSLIIYTCHKVLETLFKIINEGNDDVKVDAFKTLFELSRIFGKNIKIFLGFTFLNLMSVLDRFENDGASRKEDFEIRVLEIVKEIIRFVSYEFCQDRDFPAILIAHLLRFVNRRNPPRVAFEILYNLMQEKSSTEGKTKDILNSLLAILVSNPATDKSEIIFKILRCVSSEELLDITLNVLIKLVNNYYKPPSVAQKSPSEIVLSIYSFFEGLLHNTEISNYYSVLIRASIDFILALSAGPSPTRENLALIANVKNFLINFVATQKEKCISYLPLIHAHV